MAAFENEQIDFARLPHDIYCSIFRKFDYNQFSVFEESSQFAYLLCSKNQHLDFHLHTPHFIIYENTNNHNYYKKDYFGLSIPNCPDKVKIKTSRVKIEGELTRETRDFLIHKIEGVSFVEFYMPKYYDSKLAEFFKKVPFDVLHMKLPSNYFEKIWYDTSRVKEVIVVNCSYSFCKEFFSIKAEEKITLCYRGDATDEILNFIKEQTTTNSSLVKTIITDGNPKNQLENSLQKLGSLCSIVENAFPGEGKARRRWAITRPGEKDPFMKVETHREQTVLAPWV